ncbi:hypothetical protein GR268_47310 [Rhizobium leguminosarum]|nr:hypothetical protein [Rhizobium leguminosarum]
MENMKEDRELYDLLEEDLETVERFYLDQLVAAHKRFYQLLQHCIKMVPTSPPRTALFDGRL